MTTSFRILLLFSFVLLGRPQDILPFLQPFRPALVVTVLAIGAMVFGARRQELWAALSTPESKRYLLLFLIMIVGIPFAAHRRLAFQYVFEVYIVNMVFFFFLVLQVTSLQRLKSLVWVICLSTLMYSFFGGVLQTRGDGVERFEVLGGAFDANDTAFVLTSLFPLCLYFVRFDEGLLKRLVAVGTIFSAIAVILLTGSRGGILALGTVLLVLFLKKTGGIKRTHKMVLMVMLASAFLLMRDSIDLERYMTIFDLSSDYNVTSEGGRVTLWKAAIDLTLANPITGVGVRMYSWAYYLAREGAGDSYLRWHTVHNSYLQISSELGLIGFGVFMLIMLRSALTFLRVSRMPMRPETREASELRVLGGLMLIAFAGLSVAAIFLAHGYSILFTLYFALAAAIARIEAGPDIRPRASRTGLHPSALDRASGVLMSGSTSRRCPG